MTLGKAQRHELARTAILSACWTLARRKGLTGFSLKDVAAAVGVQAPSLYSYFRSKNAMYDAMFAEGNRAFLDRMRAIPAGGPVLDRLRAAAHGYVRFCLEDPARHQLLFQRTIEGFEPSAESYAIALETFDLMRAEFAVMGIVDPRELDLWTALLSGLVAQQLANQPGGDRWTGLVDDAVDMFASFVSKEQT